MNYVIKHSNRYAVFSVIKSKFITKPSSLIPLKYRSCRVLTTLQYKTLTRVTGLFPYQAREYLMQREITVYEVIAGRRRVQAADKLGWKDIPCRI